MLYMFETFEHEADIGIRGIAETKEKAFADCARAMFSIMANLKKIEAKQEHKFKASAEDLEALLVEFLNELLYLKDVNESLYNKFDLYITKEGKTFVLTGKAFGETIDAEKHAVKTEVKAASYHQLKVSEQEGKWTAQCVVDV